MLNQQLSSFHFQKFQEEMWTESIDYMLCCNKILFSININRKPRTHKFTTLYAKNSVDKV